MTEESGEFVVRRIVVELDASVWEFSRVESALQLAARLKVRLLARFVEDSDLLRLAELPASQEIRWGDASLRPLDLSHTRRVLRIQAEHSRRRLLREAEKARVECSFETVERKTLRLQWDPMEADLVVVGRSRKAHRERAVPRRPGATSVLAFYNGGDASRRTLAAAARIAVTLARRLQVFVLAKEPEKAEALRREVAAWLEGREVRSDIQTVGGVDPALLPQDLRGVSVIPVFSRRQDFVSPAFLERVLDSVDVAVAIP